MEMVTMPFQVEAVIVTWNKKEDVLSLLGQLADLEYPEASLNITVVDNDSSDGTATAVKELFPEINLIVNQENLGGAGGFNTGMRWVLKNKPQAQYLWLLDNDVKLDKHTLSALVHVMEDNKDAALCGSMIINVDDHDDLIEVGAFIDYKKGEVKSNIPDPGMGSCQNSNCGPDAVFDVDYVAACSLLARVTAVKELGVWHDDFFIYWDDMEWGARFKKAGYRVLASNASKVYHPSWAARITDSSAVWRSYYRTRNGLWFFNNYTSGVKKYLLLARIIIRSMAWATVAALEANPLLAQAYINAISDFFNNQYGKRNIRLPDSNLDSSVYSSAKPRICLFVPNAKNSRDAEKYVDTILAPLTDHGNIIVVTLEQEKKHWAYRIGFNHVFTFGPDGNFCQRVLNKLGILIFLKKKEWDFMLSPPVPPKIGALYGKDLVRVDFKTGKVIFFDKIDVRVLFGIPVYLIQYLVTLFLRLPGRHLFKN